MPPPGALKRKVVRRLIDGVLLLDKPQGMTSNAALQTARRLLNAAKAGHTGTLDPMATGLLPLTFGEATKFSQMLLDADKAYEASIRLGVETDSGDADGAVISEAPVTCGREEIAQALGRFVGDIEQVPPMYSALKRDGRPLYEYARAGIEVERAPRRVRIHALDLLEETEDGFRVRVVCSKGTYIRSLAMDLGRTLGCGAHLSALRRTRIGPFEGGQTHTLATLELCAPAQRDALLLPADALVGHLPRVTLEPAAAAAIVQGRVVETSAGHKALVRIYDADERFLGLGECHADGRLSPKRLIATGGRADPARK